MKTLNEKVTAINGKVDATKTAYDINDGYIKTEVSNQFGTISSQVRGQGDAIMAALDAMQDVRKASGELQQKASIGGTEGKESMNKPIMEHRVTSNLDKLTHDASGFQMWNLRLKNALKQVDENYNAE